VWRPLRDPPRCRWWPAAAEQQPQPLGGSANVTLTITKIIPMILQRDIESDNNIMPMLSKYLLLFLVPYDNMLIIITGKNSSRVPFQTGL